MWTLTSPVSEAHLWDINSLLVQGKKMEAQGWNELPKVLQWAVGVAFHPKLYCKVCDARKQNCDLVKFFQLLGTGLHTQEPLETLSASYKKSGTQEWAWAQLQYQCALSPACAPASSACWSSHHLLHSQSTSKTLTVCAWPIMGLLMSPLLASCFCSHFIFSVFLCLQKEPIPVHLFIQPVPQSLALNQQPMNRPRDLVNHGCKRHHQALWSSLRHAYTTIIL